MDSGQIIKNGYDEFKEKVRTNFINWYREAIANPGTLKMRNYKIRRQMALDTKVLKEEDFTEIEKTTDER